MILDKHTLLKITGGSVTPTLINAITKGVSTFLDFGRVVGTVIRRVVSGKTCSL